MATYTAATRRRALELYCLGWSSTQIPGLLLHEGRGQPATKTIQTWVKRAKLTRTRTETADIRNRYRRRRRRAR